LICTACEQNHLVIPAVKTGGLIDVSPLIGSDPLPRTILLSFRGDFRKDKVEKTSYGRGIRARIRRFAAEGEWWDRFNITIDPGVGPNMNYAELLMRSIFCLVAPGAAAPPSLP
jgi:hypothetical protein